MPDPRPPRPHLRRRLRLLRLLGELLGSVDRSHVAFEPYRSAAARFPQVSKAEFQRAVQFVEPDGSISRAAEASFKVIAHAPSKAFWITLYRMAHHLHLTAAEYELEIPKIVVQNTRRSP
jgi:hypothetical protein